MLLQQRAAAPAAASSRGTRPQRSGACFAAAPAHRAAAARLRTRRAAFDADGTGEAAPATSAGDWELPAPSETESAERRSQLKKRLLGAPPPPCAPLI